MNIRQEEIQSPKKEIASIDKDLFGEDKELYLLTILRLTRSNLKIETNHDGKWNVSSDSIYSYSINGSAYQRLVNGQAEKFIDALDDYVRQLAGKTVIIDGKKVSLPSKIKI
jgi:hypothetical protein